MKLSVIGCGYLGAVHAASMAEVAGVDVDEDKAGRLAAGRVPFYEPGFEELPAGSLGSGRLEFRSEIERGAGGRVQFLCVGSPQKRRETARISGTSRRPWTR